ncbi:unnamed protein product [Amoebophrya sp. A120]|nr:unnamed protein product [Amoebophrya sp. A120]|eukprot:GSA120T00000545001.1
MTTSSSTVFEPPPRTLGAGQMVVSPSRQLALSTMDEQQQQQNLELAAIGGAYINHYDGAGEVGPQQKKPSVVMQVGQSAAVAASSSSSRAAQHQGDFAVQRITDGQTRMMRVSGTTTPSSSSSAVPSSREAVFSDHGQHQLPMLNAAASSKYAVGAQDRAATADNLPPPYNFQPGSRMVQESSATTTTLPGGAGATSPASSGTAAQEQRQIWIEHARVVAAGTIVYCGFFALLSLIVGISDDSVALIGLAVEFSLDAITSFLVLWRFKRGKQRNFTSQYAEADFQAQRDRLREKNSGIGIGIVFLTSALFLFCMAIWKLASWDNRGTHGDANRSTSFYSEAIAWPCAIVFSVLAAVKRQLALDLGSSVLYEDALSSFLGAVLSGVVIVAGFLERLHVPGAWRADAIAGFFIAAALGYEGQRALRANLDGSGDEQHQMMQELP